MCGFYYAGGLAFLNVAALVRKDVGVRRYSYACGLGGYSFGAVPFIPICPVSELLTIFSPPVNKCG